MKHCLSFLFFSFLFFSTARAQLVINEVSQGNGGSKEFIELLVIRTNCTDTCADLRGWVVDDNGGWFGTGAISQGCIRFKHNSTWDCVPYGSLILIYNNGDKNDLITMPDDPTDANGDKVYILPVNSSELEMNAGTPNNTMGSAYPYPSTGFTSVGNWTNLAMNNNGDAIVVVDPAAPSAAYHSMSYGSITGGTGLAQIQVGASGGGTVVYNAGSNYSIVNASTGFTSGTASAGAETPGAGNTAANTAWINALKASTLPPGAVYNIADTICQGETYAFGTVVLNTSGIYKDTFASINGCDSIVHLALLVSPVPLVPGIITPVQLCQLDIAAALTATGNNLQWYTVPVGGIPSGTSPIPNTNFAGTQYYYVSQTVNTCESPRDTIEVIVKLKPAPPLVSPVNLCLDATAAPLTATGQNLLWYAAAAGGTGSPIAPVPSTTTPGATSYFVSQTIDGCESDRTAVLVTVFAVIAGFDTDADTLCAGFPVQFTATSSSSAALPLTHAWFFGDGNTSILSEPAHAYAVPGSYNVLLVSSDANGCLDSFSKAVLITPTPQVSFFVSDTLLCEGDSVSIVAAISAGYNTLRWNFGDGTTKEGKTVVTHAYDTGSIYQITAAALYDHCPLLSDTAQVMVNAYPVVTLGSDTSICLDGEAVQLTNTSAEEGQVYRWNTGSTESLITARHHGVFFCTATSEAGCSTTDTVMVYKSCYIDIPNVFTPNNDGTNDYFFPRQLLSRAVTSFEMQVFNRWGQLIFDTRRPDGRGWDGKLNGQEQPSGVYVYLIKVGFANNQMESYKGNVTLLR